MAVWTPGSCFSDFFYSSSERFRLRICIKVSFVVFQSLKFRSHTKILESDTRNQLENPVLQHSANSPAGGDSVSSSAWFTDVSQVNLERDKISSFGENEFITQNVNFYRKQYEQVFKFWDPDPTNQVDEGDVLYQQYRQRVRIFSSRCSEDAWPQSFDAPGCSSGT